MNAFTHQTDQTQWFRIRFTEPGCFEPVDVTLEDGRTLRRRFSATASLSALVRLRARLVVSLLSCDCVPGSLSSVSRTWALRASRTALA